MSTQRAPNKFLRSWVWKRESKPDRDRFGGPYVHGVKLKNGGIQRVVINQAPFNAKGFASTVWDSAIVLSKYFERWPEKVEGMACIELGAGCGLPGITIGILGASSVLLTDFPENLSLLEQNVKLNAVSDVVSVTALEWGKGSPMPFDVVVATDVMYDAASIDSLIMTLQKLSSLETTVFLAYGRNRQAEESFMSRAANCFAVEKVPEEDLDEVYQCIDVDVFTLKLKPTKAS